MNSNPVPKDFKGVHPPQTRAEILTPQRVGDIVWVAFSVVTFSIGLCLGFIL
jgi:hypothetical protein